jgi:purine-binding chemotaxis protein CheW
MTRSGYDIPGILQELRDGYQRSLGELPGDLEQLEVLCFRVGTLLLGCAMVHVTRVIPPQRVIPLPRVTGPVAGVFNYNGAITAALDLRPLLNLPVDGPPVVERIVIVKGKEFQTGLLVGEMPGSEMIPSNSLKKLPDGADEAYTLPVQGEFSSAQGIIRLIDVPRLLSLPEVIVSH